MGRVSTKLLTVIFAVLLGIVIIFYLSDSGPERSFRETLVEIDTAEVSDIYIYPKSQGHQEQHIFKESGSWKIDLGDKTVPVPEAKINAVFDLLLKMKPKRLAARREAQWNKLQVDSTGTRVKVLEEGDEALDLIIGKFVFKGQNNLSTMVRLADEDEVYEVDGFLDMTFNQPASSFRDPSLVKSKPEQWRSVEFDYPADSSFILVNINGVWSSENFDADSSKVASYLNRFSNTVSRSFIDNIGADKPQKIYSVKITESSGDVKKLTIYEAGERRLIKSDYNPGTYFDAQAQDIGKKIFIGPSALR